ncbi:MAG: CoA transferase, partial [Gammaproteobacteria bacterium]
GNLLPHLFDNFLRVADLLDILVEPEFDPTQMLVRDPERHEAVRLRMLEQIQTRSAADWMTEFVADGGVVAGPYQTTQEALDDPDIVCNGHVVPRADGGVELGPLARLLVTPAVPGGPAVADAGRYETAWQQRPAHAFRPAGTAAVAGDRPTLPLAGLKVVEIATIIAAPMGAGCLADMGADVIKVEQIGGDPFRGLQSGLGAARVNAGKRSISLDLKSDAGRAIVLDLVRDADVLIHNYRPGVPERLGIGYDQIAAINPRIVYVQANGYGPDGPGALRPSTHPIPGAAMGGVLFQFGEHVPRTVLAPDVVRTWTRRLMCANEVNPDPNTAVVIASAAMLGVAARDHTGQAQRLLVDMFGANAWANHDDFLRYPGKPNRLQADSGLHGLAPTYRLYRAGEGQWLFLAVSTRREAQAFDDALQDAGITDWRLAPRFEGRLDATAAAELERALADLFATRPADAWEAMFVPHGVGCVRADGAPPSAFWRSDPQPQAMGLTAPAQHPIWGEYQRHGRLALFDVGDQPLGDPPLAGQHNAALLAELGRDPATIDALAAAGVIWAEPRGVAESR